MVLNWISKAALAMGIAAAGGIFLLKYPTQPTPLKDVGTRVDWSSLAAVSPMKHQATVNCIEQLDSLGNLQPLPTPVVVPFQYLGEHIVVRADVADIQQSIPLILDSGVRSLMLQRPLVRHIPLEETISLDSEVMYGLLETMNLGDAQFRRIGAYFIPFSDPGHPLQCLSDQGVIGANLMRHGVWHINYQAQTLTIAQSLDQLTNTLNRESDDWPEHTIQIPITLREHRPFITLDLGQDRTINAMVDTGWGGSLQLAQRDLEANGLRVLPVATVRGIVETLSGISDFRQEVVQLAQLGLGPLNLENFAVLVTSDPSMPDYAIVGNDFLSHFIVTLDWPQQMLYLEPVDSLSTLSPSLNGYGFQTLAKDQKLWVTGLYDPSPATSAGLQVGDQILAINDDDYRVIPPPLTCDYLLKPVGERYHGPITVTVDRQGKPLTYVITPGEIL